MTQPPDPDDPFGLSRLFGSGMGGALGGNPAELLGMLQRAMSWTGGPVNWDLARDVSERAAREDDRPVTPEETRAVADAGRLADHWLDAVTSLPAEGSEMAAWTRTGWLTTTLHSWRQLVDPFAARVNSALVESLSQQQLPPEAAALLGGAGTGAFTGFLQQIGGALFGYQVGQGLGTLAGEVLGTTDVGLPLGRPALLPRNVADFADGLEVPEDEVRLYLALREAAHQRLFAHVPWLRAHVADAVEAYGRGVDVDLSGVQRAVEEIDPQNPEALQGLLAGGLFDQEPTAAQKAALARLESVLALVEGWVDTVVDRAATGTLPHAAALRETLRRRRATGGPAEQTCATLVGLQLRPRRLREAAQLWELLTERRGLDGRDAVWAHPDLLPDLDDPDSWLGAGPDGETDWDAGLRALDKDLDGELDDDAASGLGEDGPST